MGFFFFGSGVILLFQSVVRVDSFYLLKSVRLFVFGLRFIFFVC